MRTVSLTEGNVKKTFLDLVCLAVLKVLKISKSWAHTKLTQEILSSPGTIDPESTDNVRKNQSQQDILKTNYLSWAGVCQADIDESTFNNQKQGWKTFYLKHTCNSNIHRSQGLYVMVAMMKKPVCNCINKGILWLTNIFEILYITGSTCSLSRRLIWTLWLW